MVQVQDKNFIVMKLDQSLRVYFSRIADIALQFAWGKYGPGQEQNNLLMDFSILQIELVAGLKLIGFGSPDFEDLLNRTLELARETPSQESRKELLSCYGQIKAFADQYLMLAN